MHTYKKLTFNTLTWWKDKANKRWFIIAITYLKGERSKAQIVEVFTDKVLFVPIESLESKIASGDWQEITATY